MSATANLSASETAELHTQLFGNLIMQQAGMAMIFLGVTPHPETKQKVVDLDAAQIFIAQLEMLEAKTRGNLTADEAAILKQSLTTVRMAFVQAVGSPAAGPPASPSAVGNTNAASKVEAGTANASAAENPAAPAAPVASAPEPSTAEDDRKKFVKKY